MLRLTALTALKGDFVGVVLIGLEPADEFTKGAGGSCEGQAADAENWFAFGC